MGRFKALGMAAAITLAAGFATSASAVNFVGVDTITAYPYGGPNTNGGLGILIDDPTDLNFNLTNIGDSTGFQTLFRVYTSEGSAEFDDFIPQPITLSFNFSNPIPGSTGGFSGDTSASTFFFIATSGRLTWDTSTTFLNFGSGHQLRVDLQSGTETFNSGGGLSFSPGLANGADVKAKFTLTAVPAAIPEPTTWGLMIMGFGGIGAMMRRRRSATAFA